ncbi:M23 family metallopeptidase [Catellatospora tritici]|uniref:M23 family metallopeptidase n=1 Tax=Catellatospora tritici TaxID=2851566 RepID=UPI001C2DBA3E|nr:M23 family metallopeptidase [Catellatospora tritici]MBV1853438.1 peptidoglycan DD-metalloendopeptidase family protein [Catellatospora tritici]
MSIPPIVTHPIREGRRRILRPAVIVASTAALALLCCGGAVTAFIFGDLATKPSPLTNSLNCGSAKTVSITGQFPSIGPYGEEKIRNAAIIIKTGQQLKVPPRGWVIAVATAMQESSLTNHGFLGDRNDHDSLGLFQQRPSQGWGTPAQVMDPVYAATKFYQKLLKVKEWETLPLTVAAQRVQISAYPNAYAKHEPLATRIVNELTDGAARAVVVRNALRCASFGQIAASGWTVPVKASLNSGFRTASRPGHNGVDLGAARHTPIHAAAAGVVIISKCDLGNCDRDGSLSTPGCGWYVDILHADQVITRYCHMQSQPLVRVGDRISPGQVIGYVGNSGHSTGPHLHFEVHLDGDRSRTGAVDPIPFMTAKGAALGNEDGGNNA